MIENGGTRLVHPIIASKERILMRSSAAARGAVLTLLCLLLPVPAAAMALSPDDRIVIRQEPGLTAAEQRDVREDAGVQLVSTLPIPDVQVVDPIGNPTLALAALRSDPDVRWAEVDGVSEAAAIDPGVGQQWALSNTGQDVRGLRGLPGADLSGLRARQVAAGAGVTVGVVDTGAQLDHADLRLTGNPGERGNGRETNGIDDDRNGRIDDWRGWDFVGADNAPDDANGHGTHVSGTIAAGENGVGIVGVAPEAQVLPLRALDDHAKGYNSSIAAAFAYAGDLGLRVVNASLESGSTSLAQYDAIASHPNTLYVVAAGNDGQDLSVLGALTYPCGMTLDNVICVGASDQFDERAGFSNYGTPSVDLFAPGAAILSDWTGGGTQFSSGTSMAAPQVAGVAALLLSRKPSLSTAALRQAILGSVDQRAALSGSVTGGRVNAAAALEAAGIAVPAYVPPASVPVPLPVTPAPVNTVKVPTPNAGAKGTAAAKPSASLRVTRVVRSVRKRTVSVSGTIDKRATGKVALSLGLHLRGGGYRTVKASVRIAKGRFSGTLRLSSSAVKARSGTLTAKFAATATFGETRATASMR